MIMIQDEFNIHCALLYGQSCNVKSDDLSKPDFCNFCMFLLSNMAADELHPCKNQNSLSCEKCKTS